GGDDDADGADRAAHAHRREDGSDDSDSEQDDAEQDATSVKLRSKHADGAGYDAPDDEDEAIRHQANKTAAGDAAAANNEGGDGHGRPGHDTTDAEREEQDDAASRATDKRQYLRAFRFDASGDACTLDLEAGTSLAAARAPRQRSAARPV